MVIPMLMASTATVSGVKILWNPEPLNQLRYSFNFHEEYAEKIKHIDPSLSVSFSGIKETYLGDSPDRMRQALFECCKTVYHLFDCLIPDDSEVTKQPWWSPEDPKKLIWLLLPSVCVSLLRSML